MHSDEVPYSSLPSCSNTANPVDIETDVEEPASSKNKNYTDEYKLKESHLMPQEKGS